jgi:antitoxin (DNA-binding transcriptional repressor) of toxin-antitoxin stability system
MPKGTKRPVAKTISAEELELNCLEIIDQVEAKWLTFVITKDGKPIALMMPVSQEKEKQTVRKSRKS